ncbi:uncharacterized protein METZ01_LOCUS243180 [marine metagenome]|uniref:Methyltransferase domain-containing protein n=1 Tax=marine metagenome TaxID=408172 RepID=A0A382HSI9_9ZZZZ
MRSSPINEKYTEHLQRQCRRYSRPRDIWSKVERRAFGRDLGLNGYTSPAEAKDLAEFLGEPGLILDLGSGGGWPAKEIVTRSSRSVVAMDMVFSGLQKARSDVADTDYVNRFQFVLGDGQRLPFAPDTFGMVLHADVLC